MDKEKLMYDALAMIAEITAREDYHFGYVQGIAIATLSAVDKVSTVVEEQKPVEPEQPKKRRYKQMNKDEVVRVHQLADRGVRQAAIARSMCVSESTICRYLKNYKRRNTAEPGKGTIDWIRELSAEGLDTEEIAERVGYTYSIVEKHARREE